MIRTIAFFILDSISIKIRSNDPTYEYGFIYSDQTKQKSKQAWVIHALEKILNLTKETQDKRLVWVDMWELG